MATAAKLQCGGAMAISAVREDRLCESTWRVGKQLRVRRNGNSGGRAKSSNAAKTVRAEGFDLWQVLGGRGLPGGEAGLKTEEGQKKLFDNSGEKSSEGIGSKAGDEGTLQVEGYDSFNKEMSGLVGGFPGGEKGLKQFLQVYPPPSKASKELENMKREIGGPGLKARTVVPPLLMPGMTVVVKEPRNPYYMFTGIVQRVTDGRAGVIFEGGNWDKLVSFKIIDLERTTAGPPMSNPKSAVLRSTPANSTSS